MLDLDKLILPPSPGFLQLVYGLVPAMLLLLLPFAGAAVVSSLLSVATGKRRPDRAEAFLRVIPAGAGAWLIFGFLPLVSLVFLLHMLFYGTTVPVERYVLRIVPPAGIGLLLLAAHRRRPSPFLGGVGSLLLLAGLFFQLDVLALLMAPERWPFVKTPLPFIFSVHVPTHFLVFLALSVVATGALLAFRALHWRETALPEGPLRAEVRRWSVGLVLGGALLLPALLVWEYNSIPDYALGWAVFVLGWAFLAVGLALCVGALSAALRDAPLRPVATLALVLALFGLFAARDTVLLSTANQEHLVLLAARAKADQAALQQAQEKRYASALPIDPKLGEKIFNERCSACHQFDRKVVGPPYLETVPKYQGKPEALRDFILNPVKIDPAYPAMPGQGLNRREAESVARYLLTHVAEMTAGGKP
ncbi:MAG: c-type cytochrome [Acidobacteria bacterium]|nr:c-type cytochrome [Acidobacteriota bacterium]